MGGRWEAPRRGGEACHMDYAALKDRIDIEEYAAAHLQRSGRSYVCPVCGSGSNANRTSAVAFKGGRFHCFSCGTAGDVFDLAGIVCKTEDKREQAEAVARWAGLDVGAFASTYGHEGRKAEADRPERMQPVVPANIMENRAREAKRMAEWRAAIDHCEAVEYLLERGWSVEDARACGLGYDVQRKRLIIPWRGTDWYHVDRDVSGCAQHKYLKPKAEAMGEQPLYNADALRPGAERKGNAVFVVEGVMDALALERAGYEAIALGGTSDSHGNLRAALTGLADTERPVVFIGLDNDKAGHDGAVRLMEQLRDAGVERVEYAYVWNFDTGKRENGKEVHCKDWDEIAADYGADRLMRFADSIVRDEAEEWAKRAEERYRAALKSMHILDPVETMQGIYRLDDCVEPLSTGVAGLDAALDGGIRPGVTVVGAISSMGKTTLTLQIADYIAAHGRPVLFVTIEQSAKELVSKSLSRLMRDHGYAVPDRAIRGVERRSWGEAQNTAFWDACTEYATDVNGRMQILEGTEQPSVADIEAVARRMAEHDGIPPVVFIDYLQLMRPHDERMSDKQATDYNVMKLRHMAKELKTPVVVVSSLNRSSYKGTIELASFKESGAIEYGSDLLLGLQPADMADRIKDRPSGQKEEARADEIVRATKESLTRELEIVVLKNRSGRVPSHGIPVTYVPVSNVLYDGRASDMPQMKRL